MVCTGATNARGFLPATRQRWYSTDLRIVASVIVAGIALNLYASALAVFQMGGSCKEFGFTVPTWNCRQASYYGLFGIVLLVGGIAAIAVSYLRRRPRRVTLVAMLLLAVLIVVIEWPRLSRFLAIDRCLDAGGCWDSDHQRCEFTDQSKCKPLK
jgi:hypothetical protein